MKLKNAAITLLINRDFTEIFVEDRDAAIRFLSIKLTPEQLSACLSRQGYVDCDVEISNTDRLGKKLEVDKFEFELPEYLSAYKHKDRDKYESELNEIALKKLELADMGDWLPDKYYGSQDSFFTKDGKRYVRCTIRKWN